MSTASTITVREALHLLDGPFAGLARGVSQREYAIWLGSGISRERLDDLKGVVRRVLIFLQARITTGRADCPYRAALERAVAFARLPAADRSRIDFGTPVNEWPAIDTLLDNLTPQYSRLLDIRVDGHPPDYLLTTAVGAPATFAAIKDPDCEHLCLAILALEGVLPDLASANWDGLVEAAVNELTETPDSVLRVCVVPDDFAKAPLPARLLKFHGCAVRALEDPARYYPLLIARFSQITDWPANGDYALMRNDMINLAATKRTLMIGLSAQDGNIQFVFAQGKNLRTWTWPCDPPAHVFAEDALGDDQQNILRVVYATSYDDNTAAIEASALFRAYAKPALTALVLHVLYAKLCTFLENVNAPNLPAAERLAACAGLLVLRDRLSGAAEPDRLAFIRAFVRHAGQAMAAFQSGAAVSDGRYRPLSDAAVHRIAADASLETSGIRELAAALAVLGLGEASAYWMVCDGDPDDPRSGMLRLAHGTETTRVFFAANDRASVQLEIDGVVTSDDADAIVVHSTSPVPKMARSPLGAPGRTGRTGLRNVGIAQLLRDAITCDALGERFREEAIL